MGEKRIIPPEGYLMQGPTGKRLPTSDYPIHREPGFIPVENIADQHLSPEDAIIAKEEADEQPDKIGEANIVGDFESEETLGEPEEAEQTTTGTSTVRETIGHGRGLREGRKWKGIKTSTLRSNRRRLAERAGRRGEDGRKPQYKDIPRAKVK